MYILAITPATVLRTAPVQMIMEIIANRKISMFAINELTEVQSKAPRSTSDAHIFWMYVYRNVTPPRSNKVMFRI